VEDEDKSSSLRQLLLAAWDKFQRKPNPLGETPGAAQQAAEKLKARKKRLDEEMEKAGA
jgi:hypothetical protein